jgi:anti-sigma regulatory factor (Ser/Thr protein kinase)
MIGRGELRVARKATLHTPAPMRHVLAAFLTALGVSEDVRVDVVTAVGEALVNSVEHAYAGSEPGTVEMVVRMDEPRVLSVEVVDQGQFIEEGPRPGRGFGLRIARAVARSLNIDTAAGTAVRMVFDA